MAACGIAPEDDDGNAATRPKQAEKPVEKPAAPTPPPKVPAKVEGKPGRWQITVKTDPAATPVEFVNIVSEATVLCLEQTTSQAEVMEVFKVNRALFDKVKELDDGCHKDLLEAFKTKKDSFQ
jgi:hypothetical protein